MRRRRFIATALTSIASARGALAAQPELQVFESPACGCCAAWVDHVSGAGFAVTAQDVDPQTLHAIKPRSGIPQDIASCHTGLIDGYVIEGHVPAGDVERLLATRPDALGLAVPGIPIGSPGMEMSNQRAAIDTLLVRSNGVTDVFARHS